MWYQGSLESVGLSLPPLRTSFFGLRQLEAQGLALALVSPSAFVALLAYTGAGQVDWLLGLPLALGGIAAISAGVISRATSIVAPSAPR